MERKYAHPEAFCLMKYCADDGSEEEILWNSRDGVTPFGLRSKTGTMMHHVEWKKDFCWPGFTPCPGMRIFVDATLDLVTPDLTKYVDRIFDEHHAGKHFASREEAIQRLLPEWLRPGSLWVVTVPEIRTGEGATR